GSVMTTGGRQSGSKGVDELLCRLYQQLTEQQAARFGGGDDLAAGLGRYQAWLRFHAGQGQATQQGAHAGAALGIAAGGDNTGAASKAPSPGQAGGSAGSQAGVYGEFGAASAGWDADHAVSAFYSEHYKSMVGLAVLLIRDRD